MNAVDSTRGIPEPQPNPSTHKTPERHVEFYSTKRSNTLPENCSSFDPESPAKTSKIKLRRISEYLAGKKHGNCVWYYRPTEENQSYKDSPVKGKGLFSKGLREGEFTFYWVNGSVKETICYKDDLKHGPSKSYYEDNCRVLLDCEFYHNERHGDWVWYYRNGYVKVRGRFFNGAKQGKWEFFYSNGARESEGSFIEKCGPGQSENSKNDDSPQT
jgi:hypothetical protein